MRLAPCLALLFLVGDARASEDPITLRLGTLAIEGSRYMKDIAAFSADIDKRTRGRVKLEWIPDGRLGNEQAMVSLIERGQLDGGGFSETGLATLVPEMVAWQAPGLFRSYADVDRATSALHGTTRELFARHDAVFVMWADLGFAHVFATASQRNVHAAIAIGAEWLAMPLDDKLFEVVARGAAPAWALPPLFVLAVGPNIHAQVMWRLRYRYVIGGLVISRAAWARLTEAQQATVLEVGRAWQPKLRESWRRETERGVAALAKVGVEIQPSSDAEQAAFSRASADVRPTYVLTPKIVAAVEAK